MPKKKNEFWFAEEMKRKLSEKTICNGQFVLSIIACVHSIGSDTLWATVSSYRLIDGESVAEMHCLFTARDDLSHFSYAWCWFKEEIGRERERKRRRGEEWESSLIEFPSNVIIKLFPCLHCIHRCCPCVLWRMPHRCVSAAALSPLWLCCSQHSQWRK